MAAGEALGRTDDEATDGVGTMGQGFLPWTAATSGASHGLCMTDWVLPLPLAGEGWGEGGNVHEVPAGGMPPPALTPCPSPACGRGEQTVASPSCCQPPCPPPS
ncbi:hypothetical protein CNECB9_1710033 [Cupriavidus necator]|uniref:Uncharacterized protein n=1 Tax=Cupriavidus necator TaxID=106590 RepID=A0A1K0J8V8_CUPNE|nr:hypothetical protein CNECB9_1710033 [Cupriavidus necator]